MPLRERLAQLDKTLYEVFLALVADMAPVLQSIDAVFPSYTRHDPSHALKLETTAAGLLAPSARAELGAPDTFAILCTLWLHDAGMGAVDLVKDLVSRDGEYRSAFAAYRKRFRNEAEAWREFVRDHHHRFCPDLAKRFLANRVNPFYVDWIGRIAQSHGEQDLHNGLAWSHTVAVDTNAHLHPTFVATVLRLADILHFNQERAPEYMLEHRRVENAVSVAHWRAHQTVADYTIADDICYFDGVTVDDEAYWFSRQFIEAMDRELGYCKQYVLPSLPLPYRDGLSFSRVQSRIRPYGFVVHAQPLLLRVQAQRLLTDLLGDALYARKPMWFRELMQNAFDACRERRHRDSDTSPEVDIRVSEREQTVEIMDTGVGMAEQVVRDFLLVAGASYWTSEDYRATSDNTVGHVGRFGIGFASVFAVAKNVVVTTRTTGAPCGHRFLIRSASQAVRVEEISDAEVGTCVRLQLTPEVFSAVDVVALVNEHCSFPEFPLRVIKDGVVVVTRAASRPSVSVAPLALTRAREDARPTRLLQVPIAAPGIEGDFHVPLLYINSVDAYIPDLRGWVRSAGWEWENKNVLSYGGVDYPHLHVLEGVFGFSHVPSIGSLRLAVSPEAYALEMSLARDKYIAGSETVRLHRQICALLDAILADDLAQQLVGKQREVRSAIVARYSWSLLHLWVGGVKLPGHVLGHPDRTAAELAESPWPRLTALAMDELLFGCWNASGVREELTIRELVDRQATIFATGLDTGGPGVDVAEAVFQYAPSALLLGVIPDPDFGIRHLQHWAVAELCVPISGRCRSAYGLRLGPYARPFPFYPRRGDHLGVPVVAGPPEYVVLDYRDHMAETALRPTGSAEIMGLLNENHRSVRGLIEAWNAREAEEPGAGASQAAGVARALRLGRERSYRDHSGTELLVALNEAIQSTDRSLPVVSDEELPRYLNGGTAVPFGHPALWREVGSVLHETAEMDRFPFEMS